MGEALNIISILTLLLIVSLFVNLYFINRKYSNSRAFKKEMDQFPNKLKAFLTEQAQKTNNSTRDRSIPNLYPVVRKFRGAYLLIESKALDRGVNSAEYWNIINTKIKSLLDIIVKFEGNPTIRSIEKKIISLKKCIKESEKMTDKDVMYNCLDNFYQACVDNSNIANLRNYEIRLNKLLKRFSDKHYSLIENVVDAHAEYSKSSKMAISKKLALNSKQENDNHKVDPGSNHRVNELLECYIHQEQELRAALNDFNGRFDTAEHEISKVILSSTGSEDTSESKSSAERLLEISESLQNRNEQEIIKLKKVVREQRETIQSLEHELTKNYKDQDKSTGATADSFFSHNDRTGITSLHSNISDAENCIQALELELEELKSQIQYSKENINVEPDLLEFPLVESQKLKETIQELEISATKASVELEFFHLFEAFIQEAVKLESLEDLAMHTFVTLSDLGFCSQFMIFSKDREFIVSQTGSIPQKIALILKNLALNEINQSLKNQNIFIRQSHLACVVYSISGETINSDKAVKILTFVKIANQMMKKIEDAGQKKYVLRSVDQNCNKIKVKTSDIDKQIVDMFSQMSKTANNNLKNIQDLARISGIPASKIARIKTYEQEIMDEIENCKSINLKVKKAFLEILNDLEKMI